MIHGVLIVLPQFHSYSFTLSFPGADWPFGARENFPLGRFYRQMGLWTPALQVLACSADPSPSLLLPLEPHFLKSDQP